MLNITDINIWGQGDVLFLLEIFSQGSKILGKKSFRENFRHEGTGVDMWVRGNQIL